MKRFKSIISLCLIILMLSATNTFALSNDQPIYTNATIHYTQKVERSNFQISPNVFYGYYSVAVNEYFEFPINVTPTFPASLYYSEPAPNGNGEASGVIYLIKNSQRFIRNNGNMQEWLAGYKGTIGYVIE